MEEKKEIAAGSPVRIAGLILIPIIETRLHHWRHRNSFTSLGSKQVTGVITITPTMTKALKVSGEEVALEELKQELPELEAMDDYPAA